jgi:hypothetical protein
MSSVIVRKINSQGSIVDGGALPGVEHDPSSGGKKVVAVGPEFSKLPANDLVAGRDFSAGIILPPGTVIYFYNNSGTIAWATFGLTSMPAAPSGIANGIPLMPNAWTVLSVGTNNYARTSAATVGCYTIVDTTQCTLKEF